MENPPRLVAAFREPPSNIVATSSTHGGHPLWWRDQKPDYHPPLHQGLEELPPRRGLFGSSAATVEEFRPRGRSWSNRFRFLCLIPPSYGGVGRKSK